MCSIFLISIDFNNTCPGVKGQSQQLPALRLCAGRRKTAVWNAQSARTSTSAARTPTAGEDVRSGWPRCLQQSDFNQGVLSCRMVGAMPMASARSDQHSTSQISNQVCSDNCFFAKATSGNLNCLKAPLCPGRFKLKVSMLSDLSHWHGAPSPQRPRGRS